MSTEISPTSVRYSARDFDTLTDDLLKRLKDLYGDTYNDFSISSLGLMLVDLFSFTGDQLSFYIDRRASECFLETALKRENVERLARQIGYAPGPATSASVDLSVTPVAQTFGFSIPVGFQFAGPSNLIYEAAQEVSWSANDATTKTVSCREVASKRLTTSSTGASNQRVRLAAAGADGKYLIDGTVRVFVDGVEWTELDFLQFEEENTFVVHYLGEPPYVRFGNGVSGNIPPQGAEIRILFEVGSGESGNVARGTIDSAVRPLVQSFTSIGLTVTNLLSASGGSPPETIESIKANAPQYFAARGVAVTQTDYVALSTAFSDAQYGRPATASAFVARVYAEDMVANGLVIDIQAEIEAYQTLLGASATTISSDLTTIQVANDDIQTKLASLTLKIDSTLAQATSILSSSATIKGKAVAVERSSDALEEILTNPDVTYTYSLAEIVARLTTIGETVYATDLGAMQVVLTTMMADLIAIKASLDSTTSAIDGSAQTITTDSDFSAALHLAMVADAATIDSDLVTSTAAVVALQTEISDHDTVIDGHITSLREHLTDVLSASCEANVITVPILATDVNGYYVAPSSGLLGRLQAYLQARADVAHTVQVVSGEDSLVGCSIAVELRVLDAFTHQEVADNIESALKTLLKARPFGESLYLHTVHELIGAIVGVDVVNITITSAPDLIDASGNLVITQQQVITYTAVSVTRLEE